MNELLSQYEWESKHPLNVSLSIWKEGKQRCANQPTLVRDPDSTSTHEFKAHIEQQN